jgi:hypothetical protein
MARNHAKACRSEPALPTAAPALLQRARDARCAARLLAHVEGGGKMFWAVAGAMSSAQLGITLAPAIRAGLIHGLSVTGANLEESLFRLVAHDHYKDFPDYRYFTQAGRHPHPRASACAG